MATSIVTPTKPPAYSSTTVQLFNTSNKLSLSLLPTNKVELANLHVASGAVGDVFVKSLLVENNVNVGLSLSALRTDLTSESSRALAAETVLTSSVASEVSARTLGQQALTAAIVDLDDKHIALEAGIVSSYVAADLVEHNRAVAAESKLTTDLASAVSSVDTETTRAIAAENKTAAALKQEILRAYGAEKVVSDNLTTERNARISDIVEVKDLVSTEADTRLLAVQTINARIDTTNTNASAEVTRATGVEATLQGLATSLRADLTSEVARATGAETLLTSRVNSIISNIDPAALDSFTEIVASFSSVDTTFLARLVIVEKYLKQLLNVEYLGDITIEQMLQVAINISSAASYVPDESQPVATADTRGWGFVNSSVNKKINWYFISQDSSKHGTLKDLVGVYAHVKFNVISSLQSLPILGIYTKPQASGNAGSWYRSRRVFIFPNNHGLVSGGECLMYYGEDMPAVLPGIPHVKLVLSSASTNGTDDETQEVLTVSFGTDSSAPYGAVDLTAFKFLYGFPTHTCLTLSSSTTQMKK